MEVGVRELRNHLSRYLHRMRYSDEVVVTDRGRCDRPRPHTCPAAEAASGQAHQDPLSSLRGCGAVADLPGEPGEQPAGEAA
jgi:hypothetical protein